MDIKFNLELSLSRETLDVLRQFAPDVPAAECNCTAADKDLKTFIKETVYEFLRDLQEHAKKPVEEPKTISRPRGESGSCASAGTRAGRGEGDHRRGPPPGRQGRKGQGRDAGRQGPLRGVRDPEQLGLPPGA